MEVRSKILTYMYKLHAFNLRGDAFIDGDAAELDVSCIINFYGRIDLLEGILYSLLQQNFLKERFEIILVEDRGGTAQGLNISEVYGKNLNIRYFPLPDNYGKMGFSRNLGLSKARGKYTLFLDDDTVILDKDFLAKMTEEFETTRAEAIIPYGASSYCMLKGRYGYHDTYFPTNRCMAYRIEVLKELGGFVSDMVGQEDVEFVVRFIASSKSFHRSERLTYLHPPLILKSVNKAAAVGISFARLKKRYPFIIWLMLLANGSRYLPLVLLPINTKWRMLAKFSTGFILGIFYAMLGKSPEYR